MSSKYTAEDPWIKMTPERIDQAITLWTAGKNMAQIGRAIGVYRASVRQALRRRGFDTGRRHTKRPQVEALLRKRLPVRHIAAAAGVHVSYVWQLRRRQMKTKIGDYVRFTSNAFPGHRATLSPHRYRVIAVTAEGVCAVRVGQSTPQWRRSWVRDPRYVEPTRHSS